MGFVVLAYDAIGHGERLIQGNIHHEGQYALLPLGETIAGWMVWDTMRGIDYLISLPEVDPKRIGVTGNSGGGLATLYTAALEPRATASTIAGYTFQFANWMKYAGAHGSCSQLIGVFRHMEWFEIAGLIAPRAVQMLQGERDGIFPVSGARTAGYSTEALYTVLGAGDRARLEVVPQLGHAFSRPYRERMYGWMALYLLGEGDGSPMSEGSLETLSENDPRLRCDPDGSLMKSSSSVVELASMKAMKAVTELESEPDPSDWIEEFTAPPYREPHNLMPRQVDSSELGWATLEKTYFVSEIGQHIPGLLWKPKEPIGTVIVVDDRGKSAVAESDLVNPLVSAGYAVLSVDLRGRGETLGRFGNRRDNNYHFVLHSIMWGLPPSGRRAFDLKRTADYLYRRSDLPVRDLAVVGLGDDALPALLAAASDERFKQLACVDFYSSFVSQMIPADLPTWEELFREWNVNANRLGRIQGKDFRIDLGSVIPSVLEHADIPELVSLVSPRKVLYCQTRDKQTVHQTRFSKVTGQLPQGWLNYEPKSVFSAARLLSWLADR
jgi:dienelactone hydrolase